MLLARVFLSLLFWAAWVSLAGATEPHWAYRPIQQPPVPKRGDLAWCRGKIDRFIQERLEHENVPPSPRAEPGTLLRRVSLDLTGLPPTVDEYAEFNRDPSPEKYQAAVERLLASPHFGERWASWWLDAARYADTQGYEKDNLRITWAYRDYVIQAFNRDLPFDQFTIDQLAGDLLPGASTQQLVATAFHRQTMTNTEGGTDAEEFRIKAVVDRVNTTAQVWLGTTMACAQCHDHPHDPFTQRDYYGLFAIFNNTEDANESDDRPLLTVYPVSEYERIARLQAERAQLGTQEQTAEVRAQAIELDRQLAEIPETTVPVMRERQGDQQRTTRLFGRGSFLQPRETITAATPAALPAWSSEFPRNRLGLAKWLVSPENPLVARVLVNRLWSAFFGSGLLGQDDFGTAGGTPTHPELLDHLAHRLSHEWRWSVKSLLREMVLSAAYQQSSRVTPELLMRDPENRLLARMSRFRLPAETLRDQALAISQLLSPKMYGRSVMPPQPEGQWQVVYNIQRWIPSRGEDRNRRSLYTFWRRTSPFPALATLEAPSRESCATQRVATSTPMAALAMLNDETQANAAEAFAARMLKASTVPEEQIAFGYQALLGRRASADTLQTLLALHQEAGAHNPDQPVKTMAQIATVLLNLDPAWMHE